MAHLNAIKNPNLEQQLFFHRVMVAGMFIALFLLIFLGRIAYLQIIRHEHFTDLSQDNRLRVVALPPPRGLIHDRNGILLAENLPSYRLEVMPSQIDDLDKTLQRLAHLIKLDENDIARFEDERRRKQSFQSIPLRFDLSDKEVARFAVNRHLFPGLEITARLKRHYPLADRGVHALGYVGRINENERENLHPQNYEGTSHSGKLGIEKYYEDILHGKVGYQQVEINAQGRTLSVLSHESPVRGTHLILTLDSGLQRVAEEALEEFKGAVIAMDPTNGEILALASMPTYDPNLFVNGISPLAYNHLRSDPKRPLFNRAVTGQYPPGSTVKPLVALAGLNYEVTWAERTMMANGYYRLPNSHRKYRDWKRGGHGLVDMAKSITQSCDVYFYDLAHKLEIERIHDFLALFGLGKRIGLDTTGESSGLLPSREWKRQTLGQPWYPGETVITGIGQGYMLTTPLQLVTATSVLAMRGNRVKPVLLRATNPPDLGYYKPYKNTQTDHFKLQNEKYWDQVIQPMIDVAHKANGTAYTIGKDAKYTIAGKTGTAQVFSLKQNEKYNEKALEQKLRDHSLFVGFAPAEDPKIAVAVVIENAGPGGKVAAPVARKVMDYYLLGEIKENIKH